MRKCLHCRGLMAKQSLQELGLAGLHRTEGIVASSNTSRSEEGFVAGVRTRSGVDRPADPSDR